jgi:hypothetical protein
MSKKIVILVFLPLFLASFGLGQSLAEAAKKEKERRENLKGRITSVMTNADLAKVKKKPAVPAPAETAPAEGQEAGQAAPKNSPAGTGQPRPAVPQNQMSQEPQTFTRTGSAENQAALEAKWNRAKEWVELLKVKMLALQQQMALAGNQPPKDQIQKEMNDLSQRIQQAQADEKKAKEDLDKITLSQVPKR